MKSRWLKFSKVLIVLFTIILFLNAMSLFVEIKRDINYYNRAYGLTVLDDNFSNGEYYQVYLDSVKNEIADENPDVDTSQLEAFGRVYNAYLNAYVHKDKSIFIKQLEKEKAIITWDKINSVIELLQNQLDNQ